MTQETRIPQGYKDSPLGIIPEEWEVKRLGELFSFKNGINAKKESYGGGIPFVNTMDVLNNTFLKANILRGKVDISPKTKEEFCVAYGDVLFNRTSETREEVGCSSVYIDAENSVFGGFIIRAHDIFPNLFDAVYKGYCFQPFYIRNQISSLGNGAIRYNLGQEDLSRVKILVPPILEQQRIVSVLHLWDTAIEKQSELIEKLKLRKIALMQQLLTGKKRLPGFCGEWKEVKLGDIAVRITRKNAEDNKNVVTISAQRGFVIQTDFFNKSVASEIVDNYFLVHRNEFCYNKSYSYGYPMGAIKRLKVFDKAVVTTLYICFRLKEMASVNIDFFEQYCESGIFNKELVKIANEGGRAHGLLNVTPSDFFNMHMSIPDIDEQNAIASVFVNADKEIELANGKLANLKSQKRGLMQQLLTGKKRIN
ncbi:MAG: restriction endonuclease subunit S [Bacteroidaceae bacterium]|nr:restriction endonuclease subunit S [Bacteroidaceae bacterium]